MKRRLLFSGLIYVTLTSFSIAQVDSEDNLGEWKIGGSRLHITRVDGLININFEQLSLLLPKSRIVSQVVPHSEENRVFILIDKTDKFGSLFYDRIIVLTSFGVSVQYLEAMCSRDLSEIDGKKRFVSKIGEIRKYPHVEFMVARQVSPKLPSKIEYRWEYWDVETTSFISSE